MIESIRLVTDGDCWWNLAETFPVSLEAFKRLKKLSWKGLRSVGDFKAIASALRQNSNQLRELELDMIRSSLVTKARPALSGSVNSFAAEILKIHSEETKQMFPALEVLSLSGISFLDAQEIIVSAFNFSSLRSLKLCFCPGWEDVLDRVTLSKQPIHLKSLEIQSSIHEDKPRDATAAASRFLESFVSLEEFFISTPFSEDKPILWKSLLKHKSTLKRFAHHPILIGRDGQDPHILDQPIFSSEAVSKLKSAEPLLDPCTEDLDLEFIGVCGIDKFIV